MAQLRNTVRGRSQKAKRRASKLKRIPKLLFFLCMIGVSVFLFFRLHVIPHFFIVEKEANILVVSHNNDFSQADILYLHLNKQPEENKVFVFDPSQEVVVPGGYGKYSLKSVYPLLALEKSEMRTIGIFSDIFGVVFSNVVAIDRSLFDSLTNTPREVLFFNAMKEVFFNQESFQQAKILYYLQQLGKESDVEQVAAQSQNLSVGDAPSVYTSHFDHQQSQNCSIAVLNATYEPGLARKFTTLFEQSGLYVIRVAANDQVLQESVMFVDPQVAKECAGIISEVVKLFDSTLVIKQDAQIASEQRAKIIFFLGENDADVFSEN